MKSMNDPTSDYINANFVQQRDQSEAYIAAQGPTANTVGTFIRMIWEKNVFLVAMVTGLVEAGRLKCERYWPEKVEDPPMVFGNMTVETTGITEKSSYMVTNLTLTCKQSLSRGGEELVDEERKIRHYWFTGWPDHGVPSNSTGQIYCLDFLDMVAEIRKDQAKMTGCPLVVHCSAGIGRTGTYIAIDQGISMIRQTMGTTVDVNVLIEEIRCDRMALVQNAAQYKFAYQALLDYGVNANLHVYAWEESLGDSARRHVSEETMKRNGQWTVTYEGGQMLKRYNDSAPKVTTDVTEMVSIAFSISSGPKVASPTPSSSSRGGSSAPGISGGAARRIASNSAGDGYGAAGLDKMPWFVKCERSSAVAKVAGLARGHFCVRPSRQAGCYALTVQEHEGAAGVVSVLVVTRGDGTHALNDASAAGFASMPELVKFFTDNPYGEHPTTGAPLYLAKACLF
jgi:protein tyrosine phosphatase